MLHQPLVVEQEGAHEVLVVPTVWAGPYLNVLPVESYTLVSAGWVSQIVTIMD